MNPQAKLMQGADLLTPVTQAIDNYLRANKGETFSSNQLFFALPVTLQTGLAAIAARYIRPNQGACSDAASYVGTAASMLSNGNPAVIHDRHFHCPVLGRHDDAFRMI